MTTGGWNVAGRQFRTRSDYEAACRDNKKIEKLKQSYNLEDSNRLRELNEELQSGKYSFETMVGEDFIYEIEQMTKLAKDIPAGKKTKKKHAIQKTEKQGRKKGKNFDEYDKNMQVEILWQLRQREKRRKWIIILCSLLAVTCFGYYGIYYYFVERTTDTYKEWAELKVTGSSATSEKPKQNYSFEEEVVEKEVLDEYKILYNKNKSLIGWVKIDDTIIDYPVMQTENNTYYLDHNVEQEYDKNGSIFLDKDCDVLKPSMNLIA